jgi:hypothetical protein
MKIMQLYLNDRILPRIQLNFGNIDAQVWVIPCLYICRKMDKFLYLISKTHFTVLEIEIITFSIMSVWNLKWLPLLIECRAGALFFFKFM